LLLLVRAQIGESLFRLEPLFDFRREFFQALRNDCALFNCESRQRPINEMDDPGFTRAGRVICGNDLSRDGLDFSRLFWSEEFKLDRRRRLRGAMRMLLSCENLSRV